MNINLSKKYNSKFYSDHDEKIKRSAEVILPIILKNNKIKSCVDIGCGVGTWLEVLSKKFGCKDILGVDGNWVKDANSYLNESQFHNHDLFFPEKLKLGKRFDLVMCLEVAEHIPEIKSKDLIKKLCELSDNVLFSAAIPFQGGTNHINEQWQSYWKALFELNGYVARDIVRPVVWDNKNVKWWYAQNILVYTKKTRIKNTDIKDALTPIDLVHPNLYKKFADHRTMSVKRTLARVGSTWVYKLKSFLQDKK